MLVLTINRKPYMAIPKALSKLTLTDLQRSKSRSLRFWVVWYLYGIDIFASSNITTIWRSQKGVCWRAGFCAIPEVFLVINWFCLLQHMYQRIHYCIYTVNRSWKTTQINLNIWSLKTGCLGWQIQFHWNVGPSARNKWSFNWEKNHSIVLWRFYRNLSKFFCLNRVPNW